MRPTSNGRRRRLAGGLACLALPALGALAPFVLAQEVTDLQTPASALTTAGERLDAVLAAAASPGSLSLAVLVAAVDDPDPWVRRAAIGALGSRKADRQEQHAASQGLLKALASDDPETREVAAAAAAELRSPELRDALSGLTADANPRVGAQALAALQELGDPAAAPAVALVLARPDEALRHRALVTLQALATGLSAQAGAHDRVALERLAAGFQQAALAVAALARESSATMPLRQHAVLVLGSLPSPSAHAALESLAADADPTIAQQAQLVLRMGARPSQQPHGAPEDRP